jgi:hypothetical protein
VSKSLLGPQDTYIFEGSDHSLGLGYENGEEEDEIITPFHFRTFRFIKISIAVGSSELVLKRVTSTYLAVIDAKERVLSHL